MQKRQLGQTDISLSPIGLGTVKFGRNESVKYPQSFPLPTDKEILNLLSLAKDLGINYLDTAPAYGESESRIGKLLKNNQEWIIVTKVGENFVNAQSWFDFSKLAIQNSIHSSLINLKREYLDIVLVHSDGNDLARIEQDDVFNTLADMKKSGKIRAFGMSSKTKQGGLLSLKQADLAMVTYRPGVAEDKAVIDYAAQQQKGILIKKALASGHLNQLSGADPVANTMRYILTNPGVTSVVIGTLNMMHLQENVEKALAVLA